MAMGKLDKDDQNQSTNRSKGKSCKGCLYYSSALKSKSQNPTCVGVPRTLQQVPSYIIGQTELKASKEGRSLADFRYACVGYAVYLDKKGSTDPHHKEADLPFCAGLEVLMAQKSSVADHVPAHAHRREDGQASPQPRVQKIVHPTGDPYRKRFIRNAGLVASGVAKNAVRVGNYMKDSLVDLVYPSWRRPK